MEHFWDGFINGTIAPWRHRDYIRAAWISLLGENAVDDDKQVSLLEKASRFANRLHNFKQRHSQFQLEPESRTLTVFWLYQVNLACTKVFGTEWDRKQSQDSEFLKLLTECPELLNEKLPEQYYTADLLVLDCSHRFWMLPNLKSLEESPTAPKPIFGFGNKPSTKPFDQERYLRFALAVVQRSLRPRETRRRSWFIDLAFGALQRIMTRHRSKDPKRVPFSETQAYFYIQLAHAALSKFLTTGKPSMIHQMTYPTFKQFFNIDPSREWQKYYTPQTWDSLQARGKFLPPDLKPLPTTIDPPEETLSNAIENLTKSPRDAVTAFHRLALIPELPAQEILDFHQAIFLSDLKSISLPISPSSDLHKSHAHLLKYIHTNVLTPGDTATIPPRATQFFHLTKNSSLSLQHHNFWLNYALHRTPGITLAFPGLFSHVVPPSPSENKDFFPPWPTPLWAGGTKSSCTDDEGVWHRFHNCPCHASEEMPNTIGPNAVEYPYSYPYEHPPQLTHGCLCHQGEEVDQERFAALCAQAYNEREDYTKQRNGDRTPANRGSGGRPRNDVEALEGWVRRHPELAYEGLIDWWLQEGGGDENEMNGEEVGRIKDGRFLILVKPPGDTETVGGRGQEEGGEQTPGRVEGNGEGDEERDIADVKTLAGDGESVLVGRDEDEWEMMSDAGTLCKS
ncbi:hypothetical protein QBC35DRAFT_394247 [Podospora australis]|uniref:Uncharacterized protein n=1 Tax=Podospora australis TaxID=1536484 RepID=A0AAN6WL48_9PEZI|nr:hypothetical protein QBC35DRAFT_394247 [Podospora australis]